MTAAPKRKPGGRAGTSIEYQERLSFIEQCLARTMRSDSIRRLVMEKYGVSASQIKQDIVKIQRRWRDEAGQRDREDIRQDIEQSLREVVSAAWAKRTIVKDENGKPIIGKDGKPITIVQPDLKAILRGLDQLGKLHGLHVVKLELEVQRELETLLEQVKEQITPEHYASLIKAIAKVSGVDVMDTSRAGTGQTH